MDTLYHCILGLFLLIVTVGVILILPVLLSAAFIAAFILYFREVTQDQTKHYDSNFAEGWDFRLWSRGKNIETWIPIFFVVTVGVLWLIVMNS